MSGEWKAGLYLAREDGATAAEALAALATDPTWPMSMSSSTRWASPRPTLPFADLSRTRGVGVLMTYPHWLVYEANGRYLAVSDRLMTPGTAHSPPADAAVARGGGSTREESEHPACESSASTQRHGAPSCRLGVSAIFGGPKRIRTAVPALRGPCHISIFRELDGAGVHLLCRPSSDDLPSASSPRLAVRTTTGHAVAPAIGQ